MRFDNLIAAPKYEFAASMIDMVLDGKAVFAVIVGSGGVGKTHLVKARERAKRVACVWITSHVTVAAFYRLLYENSEAVIVFDDADAALWSREFVNLLKSATDDKKVRIVGYHTMKTLDAESDLPSSFEFRGRIIVLSNEALRSKNPHIAALFSRGLKVDLSLTLSERLDFIRKLIVPKGYKGTTIEQRIEVFELLKVYSVMAPDELSLRTFKTVVDCFLQDPGSVRNRLEVMFKADTPEGVALSVLLDPSIPGPRKPAEFCERTGMSRASFFRYQKEQKETVCQFELIGLPGSTGA